MKLGSFFAELKRRNVYKVAVGYAVVGWLLIQVATQVFPFFEIPNWAVRLVVLLIVVAFPVALVIAWAFELTPGGIKRTEEADRVYPSGSRGRAWIYVVISAGLLSGGLFFLGRYTAPNENKIGNVPAKSIAVLPFENLSRDPDNAYFAEGIQDEILTRLAKVADLKVISHTSTQRYKSSPNDLPQIAKELGVANILEGSVQKSQDQVRVNVQLINAATDAHLWADSFDRKLIDIFAVESEIATKVADILQAKLTGAEQHAISMQPTQNTEAYQLYLKGRYFWNKRTGPDLEKAIDLDPRFYYTHWNLAEALEMKGNLGEALAEYKKAVELDDDPFVLALLGQAYAKVGQRDEALKILAQLSQIGAHRYVPSYSYALLHMALGEKDKAIEWLERSYQEGAGLDLIFLKVDPMLDPLQKEPRFQALVTKVFAAQNSITPSP